MGRRLGVAERCPGGSYSVDRQGGPGRHRGSRHGRRQDGGGISAGVDASASGGADGAHRLHQSAQSAHQRPVWAPRPTVRATGGPRLALAWRHFFLGQSALPGETARGVAHHAGITGGNVVPSRHVNRCSVRPAGVLRCRRASRLHRFRAWQTASIPDAPHRAGHRAPGAARRSFGNTGRHAPGGRFPASGTGGIGRPGGVEILAQ